MRIDIRSSTTIKEGDNVLGRHTKVKVTKNKVAPPFKRAEFDIMFGEGISRSGELVDLGVEYGIIQKSGSWFSYDGSRLAQGRDAAKKVLQDNPELADEIEAKIMDALKENDGAPRKKSATKSGKSSESSESSKSDSSKPDTDEELDDLDDLDFDGDMDEEFRIDEE